MHARCLLLDTGLAYVLYLLAAAVLMQGDRPGRVLEAGAVFVGGAWASYVSLTTASDGGMNAAVPTASRGGAIIG